MKDMKLAYEFYSKYRKNKSEGLSDKEIANKYKKEYLSKIYCSVYSTPLGNANRIEIIRRVVGFVRSIDRAKRLKP